MKKFDSFSTDISGIPVYFIINFISILLFYFAEFAVIAMRPLFLTDNLHINPSSVGIFTGAFSAAAMFAKFFSGALADRVGRLYLYKLALFFCALTIFFYSKVTGAALIFAAILLHGLASGIVRSLFMSVTSALVSKVFLGTAIGIIGTAMTISMMVSAAFSSAFIKYYTYDMLFYLMTFLYIIAMSLVFLLKIKDKKTCIRLNINSFIAKSVLLPALLKLCGGICYGVFLSYGILHARESGVVIAGMVITVYAAANIIFRPLTGYILDKFNIRFQLVIPYVVLSFGYLMFSFVDVTFILAGSFLIGVGSGIEYTVIGTAALKKVDESGFNRASSTIELFFSLGIASGSIITGLIHTGGMSALFAFMSLICSIVVVTLIVYYFITFKSAGVYLP